MPPPRMPYFDVLFAELAKGNSAIAESFGRHVHWGYWPQPENAAIDTAGFRDAAERLAAEICDLAAIKDGERVLDVGCGFGGTIASLNERFNALDLTGLNIDERQLVRAREQVRARGGNRIGFQQGDACELPFSDGSFDRVLAVECIFHFPGREAFFREAFRVLKPGGTLALSDFIPSRSMLPVAALANIHIFERVNLFGHVDVSCTLGRYRRLAAAAGFIVRAERDITRNTLPTWDYLAGLIARDKGPGWMGKAAGPLVASQRLFGRLGLLKYQLLCFEKPAA